MSLVGGGQMLCVCKFETIDSSNLISNWDGNMEGDGNTYIHLQFTATRTPTHTHTPATHTAKSLPSGDRKQMLEQCAAPLRGRTGKNGLELFLQMCHSAPRSTCTDMSPVITALWQCCTYTYTHPHLYDFTSECVCTQSNRKLRNTELQEKRIN